MDSEGFPTTDRCFFIVILPDDARRSIAQNHQIIHVLQTQIEGRLAARPGAYDGRKNLLTSFDLELESGVCEVGALNNRSSFDPACFSFYST